MGRVRGSIHGPRGIGIGGGGESGGADGRGDGAGIGIGIGMGGEGAIERVPNAGIDDVVAGIDRVVSPSGVFAKAGVAEAAEGGGGGVLAAVGVVGRRKIGGVASGVSLMDAVDAVVGVARSLDHATAALVGDVVVVVAETVVHVEKDGGRSDGAARHGRLIRQQFLEFRRFRRWSFAVVSRGFSRTVLALFRDEAAQSPHFSGAVVVAASVVASARTRSTAPLLLSTVMTMTMTVTMISSISSRSATAAATAMFSRRTTVTVTVTVTATR